MKYRILIFAALLLIPSSAHAVSTVVTSPTPFYNDAQKTRVIRTLGKGEIVDVIKTESGLNHIRDPFGITGWIVASSINTPIEIAPASSQSPQATGRYLYDARVRSSMSTASTIIKVLPKGTTVTILEEVDGWYKIKDASGSIGYTASWLIEKTTGSIESTKKPVETVTLQFGTTATAIYNARVRSSMTTGNNIVTVLPQGSTVYILAEYDGWYKVTNKQGVDGYMMDWVLSKGSTTTQQPEAINNDSNQASENLTYVGTSAPAGVDENALNQYWLEKINALRSAKELRLLVIDDRWKTTAREYAKYMGETGATGHERADGSSMHQWIDQKHLDFTTRYTEDGWSTNYFTENISWGYADATTESVKKMLDQTLAFYLGEASYNGAHYRTIYHPDWNSIGSGFYFKPEGNGKYKVSAVFHYGSLNLK